MSVLLIDFRADRHVFFLSDAGALKRLSATPRGGGFPLLAKAIKTWGLRHRPPQALGISRVAGQVQPTWSALRGTAAMANTLSLAWNIPLFTLNLTGEERTAAIGPKIQAAAKTGRAVGWFRPDYGGEPHITRPKTPFP